MTGRCPYQEANMAHTDCGECGDRICSSGTFFCLVVGSRLFSDYARLEQSLDRLLINQDHVVIVSGGASGADALAERYAAEHGFTCIVFRADWNTNGKSAGYIRNSAMHEFISKQEKRGVVAFWDGKSRGTQHSFSLAEKYGNAIRIIRTV